MSQIAQVEGPSAPALARQEEAPTNAQILVRTVGGDAFKRQITPVLPEGVDADRFARVAITAVLANPDLADADHDSIFNALLRCAQDGLLPDGNEAALVVYNTKVKVAGGERWVAKAQYQPMVGGFRKIAAEHGWALRGNVIYANDEFAEDPTGQSAHPVVHRVPKLGSDRGAMIGAYAIARHKDGRIEHLVLDAGWIERVRAKSKAKDGPAWKEWPERMWQKTAAKRLFKELPLDPKDAERVQRVLEADELDPAATVAELYGPHAGELAPAPASEPEPTAQALPETAAASANDRSAGDQAASSGPSIGSDEPGSGSEKDGAAAAASASDSAAAAAPAPPGDGAAASEATSEPVIEGVPVEEERVDIAETVEEPDEWALTPAERDALPRALEIKIPGGSYQGRTVGWVLELGDRADEWLAYALRQQWPHDRPFHVALQIACKEHRKELYKAWREEVAA